MRRSGALIIAALIAGIAIGLFLKRTAEQELFNQLESELKASCDCKLVAGTWDINLLTLTARATNVAMVENGDEKLKFKEILADFSLRALRDHQVLITKLTLIDGFAKGVSPSTAPFKFIARLSEPFPPEKDYPGRWRLRLLSLDVVNSAFKERRESLTLGGSGVSLTMRQDEKTNVILLPRIESFEVTSKGFRKRFLLGSLAADIYVTDDLAIFNKIDLSKGSNGAVVTAKSETKNNDRLTGEGNLSADSEYLKLPNWMEGKFNGPLTIGGSLGNPSVQGDMSSLDFSLRDSDLEFEDLGFKFLYNYNRGNPSFSISTGEASGPGNQIELSQPISIIDEKFSGALVGTIGEATVDDISIKGLKGELTFGGTIDEPKFTFSGSLQNASKRGISVGALSFEGDIEHGVNFSVSGEKLTAKGLLVNQEDVATGSIYKSLEISTNRLPLWDGAFLTSTVKLSGPADALSGSGTTSLETPGVTELRGELTMKEGIATWSLVDENGLAAISLEANTTEGKASVVLKDFPLRSFSQNITCGTISLDGKYSFLVEDPYSGSGSVSALRAALGCSETPLVISSAEALPIKEGKVHVEGVEFSSEGQGLSLIGTLGLDGSLALKSKGSLDLSSLAGTLTFVDDLSGEVSLDASLEGSVRTPNLQGAVTLDRVGADIASADLSASEFSGELNFKNDALEVNTLRGELNGGTVEIQGALFPFNLESSALDMRFTGVQIEPAPSAYFELNGSLALASLAASTPTLSGEISVENGEYQRNIDLRDLLRTLTQSLLDNSPSDFSGGDSNIALDLRIKGDHDIFVLTNWMGAELQGDLEVTGTISSPRVHGVVSAVSGWFGFRNKRFDVNTGEIRFSKDVPEPELYLLGETTVRPASGELATILLEATGPISSPRVELFSDQGLTQRDMILLITGGKVSTDSTFANTIGASLQGDVGTSLADDLPFLPGPLYGLLKLITEVDSLSIEPRLDPRTAESIPFATATKSLSRRLWLVGESALSGTGKEHAARAVFSLLPYLNVSAGIESSVVSDSAAISADAILTLLSRRKRLTSYEFKGNRILDDDELSAELRLNESVPQPLQSLPRREKDLLKIYHDRGYLKATAAVTCEKALENSCIEVLSTIDEGERLNVTKLVYTGDDPTSVLKSVPTLTRTTIATREFIDDVQKRLLTALRNEGYLGAKVNPSYVPDGENEVVALVNIILGKPVTFNFVGNKAYSTEDFFDTIKLFERKQPFGINTISILIENIERLYRESGYLLATITYARSDDAATGRITYDVRIEEGPRLSVSRVSFEGLKNLPESLIRSEFEKLPEDVYQRMFLPSYVIDEELAANIAILLDIYDEEGFSGTDIDHEIRFIEGTNRVEIVYLIKEGVQERKAWLSIEGAPKDVKLPNPPDAVYSKAAADRYLDSVAAALKSAAYHAAAMDISYDLNKDLYTVKINAGEKTIIDSIRVEGNTAISSSVIENALRIRKGDAWSTEMVQKSQISLLKLGAFSRVEITALDGEADSPSETLLVRVVERPLQTLEVGGGANSELGIHVFGEATDLSLFKDGKALTLRLDGYYDPTEGDVSEGIGSLRFSYPSFMGTDYYLSEEARFQKQDLSSLPFDLDRMSLGSIFYKSTEELTLSFGHTILQENLNNVAPDAILSDLDNGIVTLSSIGGSLRFDRRDAPLLPTKGYLLGIEPKVSSEVLASDANFVGLTGTAANFLPFRLFERQIVFATGLRSGVMNPFEGTSDIPISQRYFLGGRTSVRGYRENSLGPRGIEGSVLGGDLFFVGNIELQLRLYEILSIQPFIDFGNVYLMDESIDSLKSGAGLGFRYLSPIGPVGLDFGYPLSSTPDGRDVRVTFNIGTTF